MSAARLPWSAARFTTVALGTMGVYLLGTAATLLTLTPYPFYIPPALVIAIVVIASCLIALRTRIPRWLRLRAGACSPARAREDFLVAALAVLAIWNAHHSTVSVIATAAHATTTARATATYASPDWAWATAEAACLNVWLVLLLTARRIARWLYRRPAVQRAAD